jgi:hypothetical protein
MNSCRMTFKILVVLLFTLALCAPSFAAKIEGNSGPTTLLQAQGISEDNTALKNAADETIYPEDAKRAPAHPGLPDQTGKTGFLSEGFEGSVPPSGWTSIINNSTYTWESDTYAPHSGLQNATVLYDYSQDEWMISPSYNFSAASAADLKISFWWNTSYYWLVTPYNNANLELWVSIDGGATWPTMLWSEDSEPAFTTWTWYQKTIALAAYAGKPDVKFAFRYVGDDAAQASVDDVDINDNAAPIGRCCVGAGTCSDITQAACLALTGTWDGTKNCTADPCPTTPTGIDCGSPLPINLDLAALPLVLSSQTTVGKVDNYNATCLGYYDSGEDVIYKITVAGTGNQLYRITMNPGTTTYTGFAIGTTCPLAASGCTVVKTSSSAVVYSADVTLVGGTTYYMQVDTWASPLNIPNFSLTFSAPPPPPANDNCAAATVIGDVTDLAWSTLDASPDGPGGWITSKNIWYKYTSTCNGNVTVSLCGSAFDTKMRIYKKDGCPVIADSIAGNDDGCSGYPTGSTLASKVRFYTAPGVTYMIEVGGYSTNAGNGLLTVTCQLAPPRDACTDAVPVTLVPGVPRTFTGNNAGSTPDCSLLSTYNETWEAFTITQCMDVTLNYCGTAPAFSNALLNLVKGCTCTALTAAGVYNTTACGDGNVTITWAGLAAGTYYYPVIEGTGYSGAYTLHVVATIPTSYCAGTATTCDEFISNVTVGTISNASDCGLVSNYSDYTAYSTDMVQGVSYPISVENGYPYSSDQCGIWIDWNNDFCFSADETVTVTGTPGNGPYAASISAPCNVPLGTKRLRIRVLYTGTVAPCGNSSYGEVEDYTINLIAKPVVAPLATLSPNPQYAYAAHALNPVINTFYAGNFAGGYLASQINLASVKVNGEAPTSATVSSFTGMYCGALKVQMPLASFIDNYGVLFDTTNTTFTITGTFADLTTFSIDGNVTLIGHASLTPAQYIVPPSVVVLPGDFDASGALDISDPVAMVAYIFAGGAAPSNVLMGDCDCSGSVDISDAVYMISYIFGAGPTPCHQ